MFWCTQTIRPSIILTFIVASLGSFGKPLTEFESIERNICLMVEKRIYDSKIKDNTQIKLLRC